MSLPAPPSIWSCPKPPMKTSLPGPPASWLSPLPPEMISSPIPPSMMSSPPLPSMVSSPACPSITSSDSSPINSSSSAPVLMTISVGSPVWLSVIGAFSVSVPRVSFRLPLFVNPLMKLLWSSRTSPSTFDVPSTLIVAISCGPSRVIPNWPSW